METRDEPLGAGVRVGVGSGNPVKRRAVERVVDAARVEARPVDSGVSEQPTGHAETIRGAETRAERVLVTDDFEYGVGIEGGVATFDGATDRFLVMWAAVTDGERTHRGAGPSLPLPDGIAERVRSGEELGPVMDEALGREDVAKQEGAAGAFTRGRLTRTDALEAAVAAAFGPFVTDLYAV